MREFPDLTVFCYFAASNVGCARLLSTIYRRIKAYFPVRVYRCISRYRQCLVQSQGEYSCLSRWTGQYHYLYIPQFRKSPVRGGQREFLLYRYEHLWMDTLGKKRYPGPSGPAHQFFYAGSVDAAYFILPHILFRDLFFIIVFERSILA